MTIQIISSSKLQRAAVEGVEHLSYACNQLHECGLTMLEPTFKEFADATPGQLHAPAHIAGMCTPQKQERVAVLISYSTKNARTFKGWLNDIAAAFKDRGYPYMSVLHVPFESYGVPMVGSVLALLFGARPPAMQLNKHVRRPADVWPDMVYHSPSSRSRGSVYAGTAALNGFLNSRVSFLPDFSLWDQELLRVEYRDQQTLEIGNMRVQDVRDLFGCVSWGKLSDLHLATPVHLLWQMAENFRLLD